MTTGFHLADVVILGAARFGGPRPLGTTQWPCPSCGERRPIEGGYALKVRNRTGEPMERAVLVCAACAEANVPESVGEPIAITLREDDDIAEVVRDILDTGDLEPMGRPEADASA